MIINFRVESMHLGHFRSCSLPCVSRNPGSLQLYWMWEFLLHGLGKYGEQAIKQFVGELPRIRGHERSPRMKQVEIIVI